MTWAIIYYYKLVLCKRFIKWNVNTDMQAKIYSFKYLVYKTLIIKHKETKAQSLYIIIVHVLHLNWRPERRLVACYPCHVASG